MGGNGFGFYRILLRGFVELRLATRCLVPRVVSTSMSPSGARALKVLANGRGSLGELGFEAWVDERGVCHPLLPPSGRPSSVCN